MLSCAEIAPPELVPARMLNEYAYGPRLCWIEWVEGEFVASADTEGGAFQHRRAYGEHLQYSVFQCELSDRERVQMIAELNPVIHHKEDQILIFSLGPAEGYNAEATLAIGRPYQFVERHAIVV